MGACCGSVARLMSVQPPTAAQASAQVEWIVLRKLHWTQASRERARLVRRCNCEVQEVPGAVAMRKVVVR